MADYSSLDYFTHPDYRSAMDEGPPNEDPSYRYTYADFLNDDDPLATESWDMPSSFPDQPVAGQFYGGFESSHASHGKSAVPNPGGHGGYHYYEPQYGGPMGYGGEGHSFYPQFSSPMRPRGGWPHREPGYEHPSQYPHYGKGHGMSRYNHAIHDPGLDDHLPVPRPSGRDPETRRNPDRGRFFVIKSFTKGDILKSMRENVWASTKNGNANMERAWAESGGEGIYLFFSVNGSGEFCGVAKMVSPVRMNHNVEWSVSDRWKGNFSIRWIFIVDVPNAAFKSLYNCEQMPVTRSRDTDEVPFAVGCAMLSVFRQSDAAGGYVPSHFPDFGGKAGGYGMGPPPPPYTGYGRGSYGVGSPIPSYNRGKGAAPPREPWLPPTRPATGPAGKGPGKGPTGHSFGAPPAGGPTGKGYNTAPPPGRGAPSGKEGPAGKGQGWKGDSPATGGRATPGKGLLSAPGKGKVTGPPAKPTTNAGRQAPVPRKEEEGPVPGRTPWGLAPEDDEPVEPTPVAPETSAPPETTESKEAPEDSTPIPSDASPAPADPETEALAEDLPAVAEAPATTPTAVEGAAAAAEETAADAKEEAGATEQPAAAAEAEEAPAPSKAETPPQRGFLGRFFG
eukprot:GGOE01014110.1.p1 GENE.GGOE01014110.1~~GGOE01014110.1.p1  ORF type:complete len:626 (-),score=121.04 GGOE01014110.1:232-2088(-)